MTFYALEAELTPSSVVSTALGRPFALHDDDIDVSVSHSCYHILSHV